MSGMHQEYIEKPTLMNRISEIIKQLPEVIEKVSEECPDLNYMIAVRPVSSKNNQDVIHVHTEVRYKGFNAAVMNTLIIRFLSPQDKDYESIKIALLTDLRSFYEKNERKTNETR